MNYYDDYKEFVINYKPFEWEINHSDFRQEIKGKHSFIIGFIRFLEFLSIGISWFDTHNGIATFLG